MSFLSQFSIDQKNAFFNAGLSNPVMLVDADLTRPFVYAREYGVFYVPWSKHLVAMSHLLAMQHDCKDGVEVAYKLKLLYSDETADYWLKNTPGAAFRSSVSKRIQVSNGRKLTVIERRLFGDVCYVLDK